jgi:hypothetical protein
MIKPRETRTGRVPVELAGLALLGLLFIGLAVWATTVGGNGGGRQIALPPAPTPLATGKGAVSTPTATTSTVTVAGTPVDVGVSTGSGSGTADSAGDELVVTDADGNVLPSTPALEPGAQVVLRFGGYAPQAEVQVVLRSTPRSLGVVVSDSNGVVTYPFEVPQDLTPGPHTLTFTGLAAGSSVSVVSANRGGLRVLAVGDNTNTVVFPFTVSRDVVNLQLGSTVSGSLVPGVQRTMFVTVFNPNAFATQLYRVDVEVGGSSNAQCLSDWVNVGKYLYTSGAPTMINAQSSAQIELPIKLLDLPSVNQDACKGATFTLSLSGQGVGD